MVLDLDGTTYRQDRGHTQRSVACDGGSRSGLVAAMRLDRGHAAAKTRELLNHLGYQAETAPFQHSFRGRSARERAPDQFMSGTARGRSSRSGHRAAGSSSAWGNVTVEDVVDRTRIGCATTTVAAAGQGSRADR